MRDTLRTAAVAAFAVLAMAFAAATLDSTVVPEETGPDGPTSSGAAGSSGMAAPPPAGLTPGEVLPVSVFVEALALLTAIALLLFLAYRLYHLRDRLKTERVRALLEHLVRHWRAILRRLVTAFGLVALLVLLSLLFLSEGGPLPPATQGGDSGVSGEGGAGNPVPTPASPPLILLFVVGLVLAGAILALFRGRTDDGDEAFPADESPSESAAAVGRTAGRAADRLEGETGVDNEIFRAWREMTGLLDVAHPEASTPGEFADAAIEAGLGREDVRELTRLFEDVRYGDAPPSEEHERRATAVFRRIEDRYAEGEP